MPDTTNNDANQPIGSDPSTEPQQDVKPVSDPSTETPSTAPAQDFDSAIKAAIEKSQSQGDTVKPEAPKEGEGEPAKTEEPKVEGQEKKDETKQEDKGPIPYERFAEVNNAKVQLEQQYAQAKPLADAQQSVIEFCQRHNLSESDYQTWMQIAALSKTDPAKAMEALKPQLAQLQSFTGELLPQDLQKAVDDGHLTLDYAKELSAARNQAKHGAARMQQTQQQMELQAQQQQYQAMQSSLVNWSESKKTSDPDFVPKRDPNAPDGKYELFLHRFASDVKVANVQTVQELVSIAEKSYAAVGATLSRFLPKSNGKPVLRSTHSQSQAQQAPKTVEEAMSNAAKKHGYELPSRK